MYININYNKKKMDDSISNPEESNSNQDYIPPCPENFESHFNFVFGDNNESNDIMPESKEEENENVIFYSNPPVSIIDTEVKKSSPFVVHKEEDYIIFRPSKMKNWKKYDLLIFKIWKEEKTRKEEPDDIRKKIKSRFFKSLKVYINQMFNDLHINKKFEFLPQSFISIISKSKNKEMLDKTLEDIIISFIQDNSSKNINNYQLMMFLKENINNNGIKKLYRVFSTSIKKLFDEYLNSEEFDNSITKLEKEGNYSNYIHNYILLAKNFVEYFSN